MPDPSMMTSGAGTGGLTSWRFRKRLGGAVAYAVLIALCLWLLFPYYWVLTTSLLPPEKLFTTTPQFLPHPVTFKNYGWAIDQDAFRRPLWNSAVTGALTAFLSIALSALGAYSLTRYRYRGKRSLVTGLLVTQMLPGTLLVLPIFLLINRLGLYNTYSGLVLAFTSFTVPYSLVLLRSFFMDSPIELEEQAMVDGCSRVRAFWLVMLPLALAPIAAVALFDFVWVWNDILWTTTLTRSVDRIGVSVALNNLTTDFRVVSNWSGILAMGALVTLPIVVIFAFLQRYLIEGLTTGAVKG
jgi:multiple sugar transport system permease protein